MEVTEQNDDQMILVVVGDDDGTKKCKISEGFQCSEQVPVPISVKIEPIEDVTGLYCTEDVRKIFPIAPDNEESIEVEPDIDVLDEECLSEELIEDDVDTKQIKSKVSRKKRAPRKTRQEYLVDEADYPKQSYAKNKKRKTNDSPKKLPLKTESISDEEEFFEIEFLEEDFDSPEVPNEAPVSDVYFYDVSSKKTKRKKNSPQKKNTPKKTPISDEEFLENEILDPKKNRRKKDVSSKTSASKKEEDEEYLPEEEDQEEYIKEEYARPKRSKKITSILSRRTAREISTVQVQKKINRKTNIPSKKPTKKTSRKPAQKDSEKPKTEERHINSFIAKLYKKQPLYKENKEELVEYLANLMRKRRPPPPLPNSYLLKDDNEYSCSYCDVDSPTEAAAGRHYQHSHGPRYLVCYACGDDFRSTANLYKHEKRCRAPDAEIQLRARGVFLGCKGRGRPYLTDNKFIPKEPVVSETTEEKPIKFYCPQCPAVYVRNSLLKEHMHKHTGFRPFQCRDCSAAYVSRHQLNEDNLRKIEQSSSTSMSNGSILDTPRKTRHVKKHSNEEFICDHCGKVFKIKSSLMSHMDTHLPRPRYGCGRCGRRYSQRSAVRVHIMRDHMNLPPPAACPVCPKRYNRMSHVKSHMKRDHGLILMTKNSIVRNLPYMKMEDLEGAKIVFNSNDSGPFIQIRAKEEILT